jgi:hypothetical protein
MVTAVVDEDVEEDADAVVAATLRVNHNSRRSPFLVAVALKTAAVEDEEVGLVVLPTATTATMTSSWIEAITS